MYLQPSEIYLPGLEIYLQPLGIYPEDLEIYLLHRGIDSRCMPEHLQAPPEHLQAPRRDLPAAGGQNGRITSFSAVEAEVDEQGNIRHKEPVVLAPGSRVLVTVLEA